MKTGVVIVHADMCQENEVVVFRASCHSGSVIYRHEQMEVELDFEELVCTVRPKESTQLYSWEAIGSDVAYHNADFGIYLCGGGIDDAVA